MDGSPPLDDIDRHLLDVLAVDGRASVNDVAARVGVARATAYGRLARLRREGIIQGFTVRVDPRRVGLGISALVLVRVAQRSWKEISPRLAALAGVEWLAATAGEFDFVVLVRVPDVAHLRDVLLDELMSIEGVSGAETVLILDDQRLAVPLSPRRRPGPRAAPH